jgi:hypothetical protein
MTRKTPFAHGIISTIDVIIKGNDQPYGVLEIDNDVQHNYDQHDIDFLTGFANVLAEAVATRGFNQARARLDTPIGRNLVIVVHSAVVVAVPIPVGALAVLWRLVELIFGEFDPVAAKVCIVLQHF